LSDLNDFPPGLGQADDLVAAAREDLETQLRFEQLDLLADAGLGRVQGLGGRRN
jgi:hypothetical protein